MFQVVGACFDGSTIYHGARLGPQAIRLAGITHSLQKLDIPFLDLGDIITQSQIIPTEKLKGLTWGNQFYPILTKKIESILQKDHSPIIIGGDRSIRLGSFTAVLNNHNPDEIGLIWIDPHTPHTTPKSPKFIHEIVLNALTQSQSKQIFPFLSESQINAENVALIGLNNCSSNEKKNYPFSTKRLIQSTSTINSEGIHQTIEQLHYWVQQRKIKKIWISFNIQTLDRFYIDSDKNIINQGLTVQKAFELAKGLNFLCFNQNLHLIGVEIVEINPILDPLNQSSYIALEWLTYLLNNIKKETSSIQKKLLTSA